MIAQESLPFTCYQWQPRCDVSRWLVAHRVWELQIKEVSKRLTAFSFRCASEADEDAQSALKVQQKISQAQSTPTENNIFDFSHKAIFLFPKKTFQWFLLRIWNKGRIFFFFHFANTTPLKLRKKPITSLTARVSAQMISHTTFTPLLSLQGHHCCLTSYLLSTPPAVNESVTWWDFLEKLSKKFFGVEGISCYNNK